MSLHGSFGTDVFTGRPISEFVGSALPHTLILAWTSLDAGVLDRRSAGRLFGHPPDSWLDRITAVISISFITIPSYVGGLFLLLLFAVQLKVMPAIGLGEKGDPLDYIKHLILPATALAITWVGYLARLVRASLLEVLNQTYIRAAMAAGLVAAADLLQVCAQERPDPHGGGAGHRHRQPDGRGASLSS